MTKCSNAKHSYILSVKRARGRRRRGPALQSRRSLKHVASKPSSSSSTKLSSVSGKLEALKKLIPSQNNIGEIVKPDQLFQETANYILLLRARIVILHNLIQFYASENEIHAVL